MPTIDTERFRLRNFVSELIETGECEVHDKPIDLIDVGEVLDGNPRAVLFKAAGPEKAELVGNVMGARKRLARALGTDERSLLGTLSHGSTISTSRQECRRSRRLCSRSCSKTTRQTSARCRCICNTAPTAHPIFPPASITPCFPIPGSPMSAAAASCCGARAKPAST